MDTTETDMSKDAKAAAWLAMANGKWRLQTLQHRSRYNPRTGEYKRLPTRIRRFLNGTPAGMKARVLEMLKDSAPYKSPVFDCELDEGLVYRPVNTFIRKDGPEHATNGKDPTYTIIQDLLLADEQDDAFAFGDESSCGQVGETEYHWDEPDVEDCPEGGQGVSYQVTDVSRDRDTDLFSYRVRKVQALTLHVAPRVVECNLRRRVTEETWDNVYGEPGDFRRDPVRGASAPVDVPAPCGQADGTDVKVDVSRNPDCTYRVVARTTQAVTDDGAQHSAYRDLYKIETSERVFNAFAPLPKAGTEHAGGVTWRYASERNEDGTWNNATERNEERPVPSSTVETRRTPRGTVVSRADANQAAPATGISTPFGSWKSAKTPGGLYNNEYVEFTKAVNDNLGLVCTDNAFVKVHETRSSAGSVPAGEHVPAAAGGLVTTWTYDTDAEGFVTRSERTEQEHEVKWAVERKTVGWSGTSYGYTHRGLTPGEAGRLYAGLASKGTTAEIRVTNGNLRDVEVQVFEPAESGVLGRDCSKTVYQHVHETANAVASMSSNHAPSAGGGHVYQLSYSRDPSTGAVTERSRDTEETLVEGSRVVMRVTPRGIERRVTDSNRASRPADLGKNDVGKTLEVETTPGGRFNVTTGTTTALGSDSGVACENDRFVHTHATTKTQTGKPAGDAEGGAGGKYRERVARLGDDGLWEVTETTHEEKEVGGELHVAVSARARRKTTITRQTADPGEEPGATAADVGRELRRTATRGGLWTVEETEVAAIEGDTLDECSRDLFLHRHTSGGTSAAMTPGDVAGGADGRYAERRQQLGDDGVWSVTNTTSTERPVPSQRVDERVTRTGLVRRTTDMQVSAAGTALSASLADVGRERVAEKTRGGLYNVTQTQVTALTGSVGESCEKTAFLHTDAKTELAASKSSAHADNASGGKYKSVSWTLTDAGTWEKRSVENTEEQPQLKTQKYKDAFGETIVTEEFSHASNDGGQGGKTFTNEQLIKSVEAQLTNGKRYTVHTKAETPTEVDSGWLHFEKTTDKGIALYHDFIVFRNAKKTQVEQWIRYIENKEYRGMEGMFSNSPHISISPNRFGLWDGSVGLTTTYTPKAWASGGSSKDDNWSTEVDIMSVSFVPVAGGKLLKLVTTETHKRGGGVGKDKLEDLVDGGVIKGSQFSFHPGGQTFSYDLITKVRTKGVLVSMPKTDAETLWDGNDI